MSESNEGAARCRSDGFAHEPLVAAGGIVRSECPASRGTGAAPVPEIPRELSERDHAQEREADEEHRDDDPAPLLGDVFLRGREREKPGERAHRRESLIGALAVEHERPAELRFPRDVRGEAGELARVAAVA